jgi:hypothetical protein
MRIAKPCGMKRMPLYLLFLELRAEHALGLKKKGREQSDGG